MPLNEYRCSVQIFKQLFYMESYLVTSFVLLTLAHSIHKIQCSLCTQRTTHVNTKFNIVLSTQILVYFKISSDGTIELK